jgi:uncharacterized protein (TIGR03435 family)
MAAGNCTDVSFLVETATVATGLPVVDETSLPGKIVYTHRCGSTAPVLAPGAGATPDPNLPSLHDALEEQLGLRLETRRGPIDVLVIDSVHQPTEN